MRATLSTYYTFYVYSDAATTCVDIESIKDLSVQTMLVSRSYVCNECNSSTVMNSTPSLISTFRCEACGYVNETGQGICIHHSILCCSYIYNNYRRCQHEDGWSCFMVQLEISISFEYSSCYQAWLYSVT